MTGKQSSTKRYGWFTRGSLLVAALAFLWGAAVEPVTHAPAVAGGGGPAVHAPDSPVPDDDSRHQDESRCIVCQAFAAVSLPVLPTLSASPPVESSRLVRPGFLPPVHSLRASLRARAPPTSVS